MSVFLLRPTSAALVQTGLTHEYRFDNGSGMTLTDYAAGQHGTLNGPDWVATGLDFVPANNDIVTIPAITTAGPFTFQFVATPDAIAAPRMILGHGTNNNQLGWNSSVYFLRIVNAGSSDQLAASLGAGVSRLITIRRDANNKIDLFENDGPAQRRFSDAAQSGSATWTRFGSGPASNYLDGRLHWAPLYSATALSDSQITANYRVLKANLASRGVTI